MFRLKTSVKPGSCFEPPRQLKWEGRGCRCASWRKDKIWPTKSIFANLYLFLWLIHKKIKQSLCWTNPKHLPSSRVGNLFFKAWELCCNVLLSLGTTGNLVNGGVTSPESMVVAFFMIRGNWQVKKEKPYSIHFAFLSSLQYRDIGWILGEAAFDAMGTLNLAFASKKPQQPITQTHTHTKKNP